MLKYIENYNKTVEEYLLLFKKYAMYYKMNSESILDIIYTIEADLCLNGWIATREATVYKKFKHKEIMDYVLRHTEEILSKYFDILSKDQLSNINLSYHSDNYSQELKDIHTMNTKYISSLTSSTN